MTRLQPAATTGLMPADPSVRAMTSEDAALPLPGWTSLATACALVAAAVGFATLMPLPAQAAGRAGATAADQAYCQQREREDGTDRQACLKEMVAARAARPGDLTHPVLPHRQDPPDARCDELAGRQRQKCLLQQRDAASTTRSSGHAQTGHQPAHRRAAHAAPAASAPR